MAWKKKASRFKAPTDTISQDIRKQTVESVRPRLNFQKASNFQKAAHTNAWPQRVESMQLQDLTPTHADETIPFPGIYDSTKHNELEF